MPQKGHFITIEGCEGCGKSTQIRMLKEHFRFLGIDAFFTREPGGTPLAEELRRIILSTEFDMERETELLLYEAARREHVAKAILPRVSSGQTVFCDRFIDSTLAYQGQGRGIDKELIGRLNSFATQGLSIDLTILIDLPPIEGFERKGGANMNDRLDSAPLAFHQQVYQGFLEIKSKESRVACVDGRGSEKEVFERILTVLKERGILQKTNKIAK
jgi:dTMP kinase